MVLEALSFVCVWNLWYSESTIIDQSEFKTHLHIRISRMIALKITIANAAAMIIALASVYC